MNGTCLKAEHVQKQNMFLWLFETIIEEEIFYLQVYLSTFSYAWTGS